VISGSPKFIDHVAGVLDELALLPTGSAILEALGQDERATAILESSRANASVGPLDPNDSSAGLRRLGLRGPGTDALLSWNPDYEPEGFSRAVIMGHELIHALALNRGEWTTRVREGGPNQGTSLNELITIGTDGYEGRELTENQLRLEWNELYPERALPPVRYGHGGADFEPLSPGALPHNVEAVLGQAQALVREEPPASPSRGLRGALQESFAQEGPQ